MIFIIILFHYQSVADNHKGYFTNFQNRSDKAYLDSIYHIGDTTQFDTLKAMSFLKISIALKLNPKIEYRNKTGLQYYNLAKEIALRNNKLSDFIKALDNIGVRYRRNGDFKTALRYHLAALSISDSADINKYKSYILNNIGVVYRRIDDYQNALSFHLKALKIADSLNDNRTKAMAINSIGNVYIALGKYDDALSFFKRSLSLEYDLKNKLGIAINLNNIGSTYLAKKQPEKAYEYFMLSLDINKEINSVKGIGICHLDIGDVFFNKNAFTDALKQYSISKKIFNKTNDKTYLAGTYLKIGKALVASNKPDEAEKNLKKSLDISLAIDKKTISQEAYKWLANAYKQKGEYKKALTSLKESIRLQDSITNIQIQKHIIGMQVKYDLESKENEIASLQQLQKINALELKKQKTANLLMLVIISLILSIAILLSYFVYTRNKKNRELEEKNREIEKTQKDLKRFSQEMLIAKQQADKSNQAKTIFLANMSHEFRTPLNSVIGFTDLMLEKENDPGKREKLSIIKSSSKSLLVLLNDILDLSKIEAGKIDISYEPVSISKIIDEIYQLFKINTDKKGIHFSCFTQKEFPQFIVFSETRLRQILFNLIGNAVKFTEKGEIGLDTLFEEANSLDKINIIFIITDTGVGIPEENIDNIFKPFVQLSENNDFKGTGLGLTITKRLIESMGGTISVKSTPGTGTTFTIKFYNVEVTSNKIISESANKGDGFTSKSKLKTLFFTEESIDYQQQLSLLNEVFKTVIVVEDDLPKAKSLINHIDLIVLFGATSFKTENAYKIFNQTLKSEHLWLIVISDDDKKQFTKNPTHLLIKSDLGALKNALIKIISLATTEEKIGNLSSCIELLKQNPEIKNIFKEHILPSFNLAWNTRIMGNIQAFSSNLKQLANEYQMKTLINFTDALDKNIQNFDINEIEKQLQLFNNLCLKLLL